MVNKCHTLSATVMKPDLAFIQRHQRKEEIDLHFIFSLNPIIPITSVLKIQSEVKLQTLV